MPYELDDFVMPIGLDKGKKLKDISLQTTLAKYLKDNAYTGEERL